MFYLIHYFRGSDDRIHQVRGVTRGWMGGGLKGFRGLSTPPQFLPTVILGAGVRKFLEIT